MIRIYELIIQTKLKTFSHELEELLRSGNAKVIKQIELQRTRQILKRGRLPGLK